MTDMIFGPGKHRATSTSMPPIPMPTDAETGRGWWVLLAWDHDGIIHTSVVPVIAWACGGPAVSDFDADDDHRGQVLLSHHTIHESENLAAGERLLRTAAKRHQTSRANALAGITHTFHAAVSA